MNQTDRLGCHAVAFLDVLGQRDRIRQLRSLPRDEQQYHETVSILRDTVGFIRMLREQFDKYFSGASQSRLNTNLIPPESREEFRRLRSLTVNKRGFSDSIIIDVALRESSDEASPINGIFATMYGVAGMMLAALAARHPMRGGIDVGLGIEVVTGEIYGPALERSYLLESVHAAYPRVVLGNELTRYLDAVCHQGGDTQRQKFARAMAEECKRFVTTDSDGLPILDIIGEGMVKVDIAILKASVKQAYDFVIEEQRRFFEEGNLTLAARYGRLRHYLESRLHLWSLQPIRR